MIIRSSRIYTDNTVVNGYLVVEDGKIQDICNSDANLSVDLDAKDFIIIPGIFDTHNHGTMGYSMSGKSNNKEAEIKGYLKGLASQGVSNIFPTAGYAMFRELAKLAKQENDGATILGIHSEGPYLNRVGEKGIHTGYEEIDLKAVEKAINDAGGLLKLMAVAPEIPDSDKLIAYLKKQGIKVAYAHSDMNYHEAKEAFKQGISISTHTANVMSGIHHRNMGGLGACLLDSDLWCEVICDGLHVSVEMLELMFKVKSYDKWIMVSDCSQLSGAPIGKYATDWMNVNIDEQGFCMSDTGRLCGSTKPVLFGMQVLYNKLHIPLETIVKMASLNPCKLYGFDDCKGSLTIGKDADFVIINDDFHALYTYANGRKIYDYSIDQDIFNKDYVNTHKI